MLKRVSIQNFKSLKDVTLDLQKVNLLIGPNNSGKTNFLKAFNFMYQFLDGKRNIADSAHYKKDNRNHINVHLTFEEIVTDPFREGYRHLVLTKSFDYKGSEIYTTKFGWAESLNTKDISFSENEDPGIEILTDLTGEIIAYRPDPNQINRPGPLIVNAKQVDAHCSNLIAFFDYIRDQYFDIFLRIQEDLSKCVPEFSQINFQNTVPSDEQRKIFGERTFKKIGLSSSTQGPIYWAEELSEGTLYFLALLCIINQPNPPKLLLLEEPEKGIHPRRIWEIMKFIFQLAEEKDVQVIMTTHNEHVVNAFSSMPESVFVFDKDEDTGATYVRNLQKDIIEPTNKKNEELGLDKVDLTSNLGEYWMYGLIGGVPANVE
ncbi:AAA family ATPase [Spirosoma soli]|uniref:AAA family ATPase n=1 Tax=Spirosoma soli TaxID=1770529 RepID=A0ABW5M6Y7_9BACT